MVLAADKETTKERTTMTFPCRQNDCENGFDANQIWEELGKVQNQKLYVSPSPDTTLQMLISTSDSLQRAETSIELLLSPNTQNWNSVEP